MTSRVSTDRPNVLVVFTDEQSLWTISRYGDTIVDTPNIDRIGAEGATFENFFTVSAVCTPSRGCLVTGRYPHCHGAFTNNKPLFDDEVTFAQILKDAGYETGYIGKWHLDSAECGRPGWIPPNRGKGFDDTRFMFNVGHQKYVVEQPSGKPCFSGSFEENASYMTDWLTDKAIEYIRTHRDNPFCLVLGIPDPHMPFSVRAPYDAMYDPAQMPVPSTFAEESVPSWVVEFREKTLHGWGASMSNPNREADLQKIKAAYCGEVKCIDDNVGRILETLANTSILDNTVVVFTSDHGDYMGEHTMICSKNQLYESVYHVPLLVRWPAGARPGTVVDRYVTMVDFQQTLLGLIGMPACGREQGRDASPYLRGEEIDWTDEVYQHQSAFKYAGIITPNYHLVLTDTGEHLLFDRRNDLDETVNLFFDSSKKSVVDELSRKVLEHNRELESPATDAWLDRTVCDMRTHDAVT